MSFLRRAMALLTVAASTLTAQQTGSITGRITDAGQGQPVAGARITAVGPSGAAARTQSRDDGSFTLSGLADGIYTVEVSRIGFTFKRIAGVRPGQTMDIALTPAATVLTAVVQTASRKVEKALDAPAQISVVTSERLEERPALTVADNLATVPGVSISQGGLVQSNIVSRGFNGLFSGSMLMLQDYRFAGVPALRVNVPFLFTGTNDDVERIEVLNGPASALFGPNSANGVLHVITKSPFDRQGTTFSIDGGERSVFRASVRTAQKLSDAVAFKLSGEYMRGQDWQYRDPGEPNTFPNSPMIFAPRRGQPNLRDFDIEKQSGEARLDVRPARDLELVTTLGFTNAARGIELTGANGASQIRNWRYLNLQQRVRWGRFFAQAFYNNSNAGNDDSLSTSGTYLLRSGQPIVDKSSVFSGQVQHGFGLGKADFTYGVDYIATRPNSAGTIYGRNEGGTDYNELGGYVQAKVALASKVDVLGAIRADQHSALEGTFLSPRAAILFKPTPTQNFRVSFNRAFTTPAAFAFFLDLVNSVSGPYQVKVLGNPPKQGWQFARDCAGGLGGGLCMKSLFSPNPSANGPATAVPAQHDAMLTAIRTQVEAGLVQQGLPAASAAAIINAIIGAPNPGAANFVPVLINGGRPVSAVNDIAPLKATFSNTFEVGWKGTLGERLRLDIAAWFQRRGDFSPPAGQATPTVNVAAAGLAPYYTGILAGVPGLTDAQRSAIAGAIANGMQSLPIGVVQFTNPRFGAANQIYATYTNETRTIDVGGVDLGLEVQLTDRFSLEGSYSWQDPTTFTSILDSRGAPFTSNAPKHRATATGRYSDPASGWGFELRSRYADAFQVNSGSLFASFGTFPDPNSATGGRFSYPGVPVNFLLDASISKRFTIGGRQATWSFNVQNALDNKVPTFVGTPSLGRLAMTRFIIPIQ